MENTFNPVYQNDYLKGYLSGMDPNAKNENTQSDAYNDGFSFGRMDYRAMNGCIGGEVPTRIVTKKTLEDFMLAGMLGVDIDSDGYTSYQLDVIELWYKNGIAQYNPDWSNYLIEILEENGIEIRRSSAY